MITLSVWEINIQKREPAEIQLNYPAFPVKFCDPQAGSDMFGFLPRKYHYTAVSRAFCGIPVTVIIRRMRQFLWQLSRMGFDLLQTQYIRFCI